MKNIFPYLLILIFCYVLTSCSSSKRRADLIIKNATVYTIDSAFSTCSAFAVKDGKILQTGTDLQIQEEFESENIIDAQGKFIFPGFIDAHCHFYNYGLALEEVNLIGTSSFNEVLERLFLFEKNHPNNKTGSRSDWIIGRGWDQNDWQNKQFPDRKKLDSLFPNRPVLLTRIDGHAALANAYALKLAGINSSVKMQGGSIESTIEPKDTIDWNKSLLEFEMPKIKKPGWSPTGILIDNAVDLVQRIIPDYTLDDKIRALTNAQRDCFRYGLTTVDDAGLMKNIIELIDSLQKQDQLKMRVYAMISAHENNFEYYLKKGKYKTEKLNVRSFKFYADGALGSRGACLKKEYADRKNWSGFLLNEEMYFRKYAPLLFKHGFQMNTHCIGDSSDKLIASIYTEVLSSGGSKSNLLSKYRWRIEHAQVVSLEDMKYFKDIIPSVQPTHATSDMYWAEERLGKARMQGAYAYQTLLKNSGWLALGTDFPVEEISPFKTFYAAIFRKDAKGFPEAGFQMKDALSRESALRGMTIWAAMSNFEEQEKGSLEKGKFADFIILDKDLMNCLEKEVLQTKVLATYLNGELVYKVKK